MEIPKEKILPLLRERGEEQKATQTDRELPDKVDSQQDVGLLSKFGIEPQVARSSPAEFSRAVVECFGAPFSALTTPTTRGGSGGADRE